MQQVPVAQVAVVAPDQHSGIIKGYKSLPSKGLGATQIAIGAICIVLQIALIALHATLYFVGHGIWCGTFFIISGSFGVQAGKNKRRGFIITSMAMSIVAASVFSILLLTCAMIAVGDDAGSLSEPQKYRPYGQSDNLLVAGLAMNFLHIILAVLEAIIAIISASLCCRPLCCNYGTRETLLYAQGAVRVDEQTGQQVMVLPLTTRTDGQQQQTVPGDPYVNVNDKVHLINEKAEGVTTE